MLQTTIILSSTTKVVREETMALVSRETHIFLYLSDTLQRNGSLFETSFALPK
ncbi:Hypothetical protein FKW44_015155, partial [Caligus rogercresseyi]